MMGDDRLPLDFEVRFDRRQGFVEDDDGVVDRKQHGVVALLHFDDDLVKAVVVDGYQRAWLALELDSFVEDRDLRRYFHFVKVSRPAGRRQDCLRHTEQNYGFFSGFGVAGGGTVVGAFAGAGAGGGAKYASS